MNSMKVKKGDKVQVIAGKDKGKQGTILRSVPTRNRVVVEGCGIVKKAVRPTQQNPPGRHHFYGSPHSRFQRDAGLPLLRQAGSHWQAHQRRGQKGPRLQEVRQRHRLERVHRLNNP